MTKYFDISHILRAGFLLLLYLCLTPTSGQAQFVDLKLDIDARIIAQTEQVINFGTLTTNSGRNTINFGSPDMGIFSVTALENQMLLLQINKPRQLTNNDPAISDVVPIQLYTRVGYSIQNYQESFPLQEEIGNIKVETNPAPGPWNTLYLFIYGSVTIGDIQEGLYGNNIVLNVEYI